MRVLQAMAGGEVGGAEAFFVRLAGALARAGVDQRIVIRRHSARAIALRGAGLEPVELEFGGRLDRATTRRLAAEIEDFAPDIVLSWMNRASRFCSRARRGRGAVPVQIGRLGGYYKLEYYQGCDHLIGNTPDIVDYLKRHGWPAERAHFVPNFVDATPARPVSRADFATPPDAPVVLALGRLHRNKAFDVALGALADLPDAVLWLAGEGPERAALGALADRLGVAARVRFLGWRDDVAALLAAADVVVCPSRVEPLGNVVIEAWAHGCPVVAAASAGPAWLVEDGASGLLTEIEDGNALAAAVRRVLGDRELAGRLAEAGREAYESRFSEPVVVERYIELFDKVAR